RVLAALAPVSAAIAAGGYAALLRGGLGSGMLRHCLVPVTPAALAAVLGLAEQTTRDLCVAMTTHGILVGDGQTYRTADAVAPLLDLGAPAYVEDLLRAGAARDRLVTQLLSPDRSPGRASPSRPPRGYWAAAPEEQAALAAGVTLPPGTVLARTLIGSTFDAVPEVSAVLATGGRYLELGCGVGGVLLTLLGMFPRMTAVAVDLSGVLLDRARASALQLGVADRVRLVHGDATRLREPEPFDVVFWSQFYFPTATRHDALVTATTSLRPGGYLLAPLQDEPSVLVDEPTSAQARQAALDRLLHGSWGVPARSGQELVAELAAEGLVGARVVDSGSARLVLARRP
ncbi:MAG: class I SAM-dependent methyltransferase, partial [Nocardioidaceae bacterium]